MPETTVAIGKYLLETQLNQRNSSESWISKDTNIGQQVVVRIVSNSINKDYFSQQLNKWEKLSAHNNLLLMRGESVNGKTIIVRDYALTSLAEWLNKNSEAAPSVDLAVKIVTDIISVIEHLHLEGIVHGHLIPNNIMMYGDVAKVVDFELAELLETNLATDNNKYYVAPEALKGEFLIQSDIWSIGAILYKLLRGYAPITIPDQAITKNQIDLVWAIKQNNVDSLHVAIPKPLGKIIIKALQRIPENRYKSIVEMKEAWKQALEELEGLKKEQNNSKRLVKKFTNQVGIEFVLIPEGSFLMGDKYPITIDKPFYLAKYLTTQEQWKAVMGYNNSSFVGDNLPVEEVSWQDTQEFIKKLNQLNDGYHYQLPSEAEWEYACLGGNEGDKGLIRDFWCNENAQKTTHIVGTKKANNFELYDMCGNVWEWCQDEYLEEYDHIPNNGSAWESANSSLDNKAIERVIRGGSWDDDSNYCSARVRANEKAHRRNNLIGFRVAAFVSLLTRPMVEAVQNNNERVKVVEPDVEEGNDLNTSKKGKYTTNPIVDKKSKPTTLTGKKVRVIAIVLMFCLMTMAGLTIFGGKQNKLVNNFENTIGIKFVLVSNGDFIMGTDKGKDDEKPAHKVVINKSFYLGQYEITQTEWQKVMKNNPSRFKGANLPVEQISWKEAQEFIKKLNQLNDGYYYRLPSEAEWEYVAQLGSNASNANLEDLIWSSNNSGDSLLNAEEIWQKDIKNYTKRILSNNCSTHPVGKKQPNELGIYDLQGNVWELCQDRYYPNYKDAPNDGSALEKGETAKRVARGGAWSYPPSYCSQTNRLAVDENKQFNSIGLRVVAVANK